MCKRRLIAAIRTHSAKTIRLLKPHACDKLISLRCVCAPLPYTLEGGSQSLSSRTACSPALRLTLEGPKSFLLSTVITFRTKLLLYQL